MPRLRLARSTIGRGYAIADEAYLHYMGQGQARFTLCHDSRRAATRERASERACERSSPRESYFHVQMRRRWKTRVKRVRRDRGKEDRIVAFVNPIIDSSTSLELIF